MVIVANINNNIYYKNGSLNYSSLLGSYSYKYLFFYQCGKTLYFQQRIAINVRSLKRKIERIYVVGRRLMRVEAKRQTTDDRTYCFGFHEVCTPVGFERVATRALIKANVG